MKRHPFLLDPSAPREGVAKKEVIEKKFGPRAQQITARMKEVPFAPSNSFLVIM